MADEKTVVPKIEVCFADANGLTLWGKSVYEDDAGGYLIERIKYGAHDIECSHEMWLTDRLFGIERADGITVVWNDTIDESVPLHYYIFSEGADEYSYISNNISADGYELRFYAENGKVSYIKQNYDYSIHKVQDIGSLIDAFGGGTEFFKERGRVLNNDGKISFVTEFVWTAEDWYHSDEFPFPGLRDDHGCATLEDFVDACKQEQSIPPMTDLPDTTTVVSDKTPLQGSKPIYLTFDDGPGKYTERVLEILSEYDVPATFFMVGRYMRNNPDKVKAVYDSKQLIGCHSVTHDYRAIYKDAESITADIQEWESIFFEIIGEEVTARLYRFPGGSTCSAIEEDAFFELHEAVTELGYRSFDWTCANNDLWLGGKSEEQSMEEYMKQSLMSSLKRGGQPKILLLHESVEGTVEMLPWIIEYIRDEGYEFASLADFDGEYLFSH
ncbi:MAG: polysaccharide deacetylase family protein [Clostridia bacterium]|nr:polysaccharide deacetylase family protein [Clostridia bacterium]